jgi:hypothetical protein
MAMPGVSGPFIVWELVGGYEWEPSSYNTIEEAIFAVEEDKMQCFVITKLVKSP